MPRDLIAELLEHSRRGALKADDLLFKGDFSPLPRVAIKAAEDKLGFPLPTTIRRVYQEIANGGFGPAYGLLGLSGGMQNEDRQDAVALYRAYCQPDPEDAHWKWPSTLLPLGHLGCAMYLCADCSCDAAPIIWFEPNPHTPGQPWDDSFFRFASSFDEWLLAWLDGRDLLDELINGDESPEDRKWKH
jgi:hypothetical protein